MRVLSTGFAAAAAVALSVAPAWAQAPSGEAVYQQNCAACHEGTLPRMPTRAALRELAPEHVETALSSFSMRRQGANLSPAERRAVAEYVTGRPSGSYRAPLDIIPKSAYCAAGVSGASAPFGGASWNGWGTDARNSRFQPAAAAGLSAADVPKLKLKWAFGVPGVSASGSQVTVVGSRVFVGTRNGMVYSLDAKTGCLVWAFEASAAVRSTPVVVNQGGADTVYFGDAHAQVYAVDAKSGALKWKTKAEDHLDAMITGGVSFANGRIFVPVASMEESSGALPTYQCCTFRGSVLALDAASGKQIWKTYTIPEEPQQTTRSSRGVQLFGPSGAGVWGAPALDAARNRVYVATGDAYSQPAAPSTDAIMALAMDTGKIQWVRQTLAGDAW
ncbi:MAG TPA: PQQ-binding-like beta-propeller repeat protein, partial [Vicinamibacterales bacterium]|nr:PQQ-binding-like beta-propeller repeat protein [Vicinamibacterales bacterium]